MIFLAHKVGPKDLFFIDLPGLQVDDDRYNELVALNVQKGNLEQKLKPADTSVHTAGEIEDGTPVGEQHSTEQVAIPGQRHIGDMLATLDEQVDGPKAH